jgi:hypothetical protein
MGAGGGVHCGCHEKSRSQSEIIHGVFVEPIDGALPGHVGEGWLYRSGDQGPWCPHLLTAADVGHRAQ